MRALLVLLLVLLAAPALAQQETPQEERSMFLAFVEDRLSAPNRQIRIQGIEGVLSSNARIGLITVADNDGVWLRITDASIVWSRSALIFSQRLQIDRLAAARIEVLRRPLPDESLPAPESSSFRLPELPVAVNLDELDVPFVAFGQDVFGLESELSVTGRIRLEGGSLDTALDITRLDGPGGRFALTAAYANESEQLDLDLQLSEPENGVIANLLGIEGRPPVDLAVQGSGPLSGLDIGLSLDAAGQRVLTGTTALRRQPEGLAYDARLAGPIARLVPAQFRDFFGEDTSLTASGLVRDAGGVVLEALNLESAALTLAANGETGTDGFLRRLNLDARLDDGTDGRIVLPVPGGDTTVRRAELALSFGETADGEWSGHFLADDLATAAFAARDARLTFGGEATDLDRADARAITFAADGALSGIVATRADWNEALGDAIALDIDGAWRAGGPIRLDNAALTGNGLSASLAGDIADLVFTGDIAVEAASVAPFSGLAGRPLQGALDLKANGSVELIGGGFDLVIDSAAQDLALGVEVADRLLAGRSTITGRVARSEDGLTTEDLRIGNDRIELTANGGIASGGADFSYALGLSDLALLTPQAAGRLEAQGSARGADGLITLTTLARVPSGSLAGKRLADAQIAFEGTLEDGALDGTLGGDAFLDGVRAQLSAGIGVRDGEQRLSDLDFTAGGARATGALARNADGLLDGALRLDAADISTVAALLLVQGAGAVEVMGQRRQFRRAAGQGGGGELARGAALALQQPLDDARAVDRHRHGLAHARVLHRIAVERAPLLVGHERRLVARGIGEQVDRTVAFDPVDRKPGIVGEAADVLHRHEVDQVDLAREQGGDAGRGVRDHARHHPVPWRCTAPIGVVARELQPVADRVADETVGAGADHGAAAVEVGERHALMHLARQQHDPADVEVEEGMRHVGDEAHCARIDDLDALDAPHRGRERARAVRDGGDAREGEGDVLGLEGRAVVEAHALAQLELPGVVIDDAPALGEPRHDPSARVEVHQQVEHLAQLAVVHVRGVVVRVHARGRARGADGQGARLGLRAAGGESERDRKHGRPAQHRNLPRLDRTEARIRGPGASTVGRGRIADGNEAGSQAVASISTPTTISASPPACCSPAGSA